MREEIARLHRAPGRQPRRAQAARRRDRRARRAAAGGGADEDRADRVGRRRRRGARRASCAALTPAPRARSPREVAEIIAAVASRGDAALRELGVRFGEARSRRLRVDPEADRGARRRWSTPTCARRSGRRGATSPRSPRRRLEAAAAPGLGRARGGPAGRGRRARRSPRPASTRPAGAAAYPSSVLMCASRRGSPGVARVAVASPPGAGRAPDRRRARRLRDRRRRRGLRDRRRAGDRRARLGTETIAAGRRDRRPRQPLRHRGQAACSRAGSGSTASPARASSSWSPTGPRAPS